jgi:hypothetical protein
VISALAVLAFVAIVPPEGGSHGIGNEGGSYREKAQAQPPARDTRPVVAGPAAEIAGVIVSDEARPRPLRRARVTVRSPALQLPRIAITRDDGTFEFGGLPAGSYSVTADKEAYVAMNYGASRPARPGRAVVLKPGDRQSIRIGLPRGAVITGTIVDADGQPAQGVQVSALTRRLLTPMGDRRLVPGGPFASAVTDDRGLYRIYGLPAGEYLVSAQFQQRAAGMPAGELRTMSSAGLSPRSVTHTPVFFPGATDIAGASRVTVAAAEERAGIDIQLQYVPLATVSGSVPFTPGMNPPIVTLARLDEIAGAESVPISRADAEGRFTFNNVRPGRYVLLGRAMPPPPGSTGGSPLSAPAAPSQFSTAEVTVDGDDVVNVALSSQPTITIAGRLAFEGSRPAPELGAIRVPFQLAAQTIGTYQVALPQIQLEPGGRFMLSGILPGLYRIASLPTQQAIQGIRAPIGAWWLKSLVVNGRDLLDAPLDIRQGADDAVATFSDQASEISGSVSDAAAPATQDVWVVVFSVDRASWFFNSRRITPVRVSADGRYSVRNLPPGEYRIIASADLDQGDWFDPAVLERLLPAATTVTIAGADKVVRDLVVR